MRHYSSQGEQDKQDESDRQARDERFNQQKLKKKRKNRIIFGVIAVIVAIILGGIITAAVSPGRYDDFAKCLTDKGVVMYGENWCQYTNAQKAMFGKSFQHINYVEKEDLARRPTWVINGETYETVQSFQRLAELSGCDWR